MQLEKLPPIENITDDVEYAETLTRCVTDCTFFAKQFMDLDAFDYNIPYLNCEERFICYRSGRQCLEENEYVYCNNSIKQCKDIKNGDNVFGGFVDDVKQFEDIIYEVKFWNGVKIKVDNKHPFYTKRGWIETKDLTIKDRIMFVDSHNIKPTNSIGVNKSRLFGYLYSDGYFAKNQSVKFVNMNQNFHNDVRQLVKSEFNIDSKMGESNTRQFLVGKHGSSQNNIIDYIKKNKLMDHSLSLIMGLPDYELREFFNGYFNGDGYLYVGQKKGRKQKKVELGFAIGISELRAYEIQYCLWRLGIDSIVKKEWMKTSTRPFYRVLITRKKSLENILKWIDRQKYPDKFERADKAIMEIGNSSFIDYEKNHQWVQVRSITKLYRGTTVGFTVTPSEEIYSYLGMRTHNCGKSRNAGIKAIHFGYFAPLKAHNLDEGVCNVIIASISKDQAYLIFEKISNFIHKSPTLTKSIIHETKTDMSIKWFNGAGKTNFIVRPIGDTGSSLRGYTTHMAIIDEAGYIPQIVYDAFLPSTVTTKPRIILASTPKGNAGAFHNFCQESYVIYEKGKPRQLRKKGGKIKWVQFHVKTYDNPYANSDPEILEIIGGTSEASKKQELEGEFLDGGNAIIPYNLMQEAMLEPENRPRFSYYELGVDTSGKGKDETVLITTGITEQGKAYPVDAYVELTTDQTKLARKIHELNNIYHYRRIYYDETGMGDTLGDICRDRYPELPVYGINFKSDKTDLYVNLERLFEERLFNLSLLEPYHREKMEKQLAAMFWEYGKYKDQPPKARSDTADDYSDATTLSVYGQQKGEFMAELPDEFWTEGY